MKTTSSSTSQASGAKHGFTFIFKYLGPSGLTLLGPIHYIFGSQIVRNPIYLTFFLSALCIFGALSLLPRFNSRVLLGLIVLTRLAWCFNTPSFSDDHFRYLHEGQASLQSLSLPYTHSAESLMDDPRFPYAGSVNHPQVTAGYLPGLQFILGACAFLGQMGMPHFQMIRILLIFFDLVILALLFFRSMPSCDERLTSLKWYAFHPLPLLEIYGNSHTDVIGACLLLFVLRPGGLMGFRNACLIALSAHIKPFALMFSLWSNPKKPFAGAGVALIFFIILSLPHLALGFPLWEGLITYAQHWHAFGLLFDAVHGCLLLIPSLDAGFWARTLCVLFFTLSFLWVYRQKHWSTDKKILLSMCAFWFCSPTLHPWYLIWLLPWVCMQKRFFLWAGCALWLGHYTLLPDFHEGQGWNEPLWPRMCLLIFGLFFLGWKHHQKKQAKSHIDATNASPDA